MEISSGSESEVLDVGPAVTGAVIADAADAADAKVPAEGGISLAAAAAMSEFRAAVEALAGQVAREHERAAARELAIDRLHQEVERLRAGETRLLLRPAMTDLRELHHDLLVQVKSAPEVIDRSQLVTLLGAFAESVELALERCGVRVIRPESGSSYDTAWHQAVGFRPTSDISLDGTVAEIISDGYADTETGRATRPAQVSVYRSGPLDGEAAMGSC